MRGNVLRWPCAAVLLACGGAACGRVALPADPPVDATSGSRLRVRSFVAGNARTFADFFDTKLNQPCRFAGTPPKCVRDEGACEQTPAPAPSSGDFVTAIDHVWQPTSGPIAVDEARASDDTTYELGLVDLAHETACSASDTGGDDTRCGPPDAVDASKEYGCRGEVVKLVAPNRDFAGTPRIARIAAIASTPERFVRLAPASDARYRDAQTSACANVPDALRAFFTDGDLDRDELPPMRRSIEPADAPLGVVVWRDPDGRRLGTGGFHDAKRGACTPERFVDGTLRCVPNVRVTGDGNDPRSFTVYADAACTTKLYVLRDAQTGYVVRRSGCGVESVAHRVAHVGAIYAGNCAEVGPAPHALYFDLIEETDLPVVTIE